VARSGVLGVKRDDGARTGRDAESGRVVALLGCDEVRRGNGTRRRVGSMTGIEPRSPEPDDGTPVSTGRARRSESGALLDGAGALVGAEVGAERRPAYEGAFVVRPLDEGALGGFAGPEELGALGCDDGRLGA